MAFTNRQRALAYLAIPAHERSDSRTLAIIAKQIADGTCRDLRLDAAREVLRHGGQALARQRYCRRNPLP